MAKKKDLLAHLGFEDDTIDPEESQANRALYNEVVAERKAKERRENEGGSRRDKGIYP